MPHYTVFVSLYLTEEIEASSSDAARQLVGDKYEAAGADYCIEDVLPTGEEEDDANLG